MIHAACINVEQYNKSVAPVVENYIKDTSLFL
jgi:hypothetical protein